MVEEPEPQFPPEPQDGPAGPWYKRRAGLVALAIVAILVVTVLTDLPVPDNRASDITSAKIVIGQVRGDLAPCTNAASEAFQLYGFQSSGTLTSYEHSNAPAWLNQDVVACSFANAQVFDLSAVDIPGTASGKQLGNMLNAAQLWATSDAKDAMDAISQLLGTPTNAAARTTLASDWAKMVTDRSSANRAIAAAATLLSTPLPGIGLPSVPRPDTTEAGR